MMASRPASPCPWAFRAFTWYNIPHSAGFLLSILTDFPDQTGAGTTASRLGMADLGVAQLHDMREHAEMIANLDPYGPPLIADMDTGYGGKADCNIHSSEKFLIESRANHGCQFCIAVHPGWCCWLPH